MENYLKSRDRKTPFILRYGSTGSQYSKRGNPFGKTVKIGNGSKNYIVSNDLQQINQFLVCAWILSYRCFQCMAIAKIQINKDRLYNLTC